MRFARRKQEEHERHEAAWELEEEQGRTLEELRKLDHSATKGKPTQGKEAESVKN